MVQKIERGVSLEDALEQTGIPIEEFEAHLKVRMQFGAVDDAMLNFTAMFAIKTGVNKLADIVAEGPRMKTKEIQGDVMIVNEPISTDLEAAKALVAFGLKAKAMISAKLLRSSNDSGEKGRVIQPDLWDIKALGPWKNLKNPAEQ